MAHILELFALVEADVVADQTAKTFTIKRIIRTYESNTRAQADLELLEDVAPGPVYSIVSIPHIES